MNDLTLAQRVLEAVGADESRLPIPRVVARIPDALALLAVRVKESPRYREFQKDFSAAPAAGVFDLSTLTGILFDLDRSLVKAEATGTTLQPVDDIGTLEDGGQQADQVYYALDGRVLRFRSTTGALNDYATALKIRANFIPQSLAEVPAEFVPALVETLAELVVAKGVGA